MSKPESKGSSACFATGEKCSFESSQSSNETSSIFVPLDRSETIKEIGIGINRSNAQELIELPPDLKKLLVDSIIIMMIINQETVSLRRLM